MNEFHVDGFTVQGNPSPIGGGFTIFKGGKDETIKFLLSHSLKKSGFTNNEGELLAIHYACFLAQEGDIIVTDSQTIMWWVKNGKSKARPDLNWLCEMTKQWVAEKELQLVWRSREENMAGHFNEEKYNA